MNLKICKKCDQTKELVVDNLRPLEAKINMLEGALRIKHKNFIGDCNG